MRDALCAGLVALAAADPAFVFLTGDLGYKALEPLREALGERFVNAGVAEQNMVSVAAGLARTGLRPWAYSIAPFLYARPYEQIRNDVCIHDLPVVLAGNGGGYAYGVMGSTHHALEDYGALLCLPNLRAHVPAFAEDVGALVQRLAASEHPAYLRLGRSETPANWAPPPYAPWRRLLRGGGGGAPTVAAAGPLVGGLLSALGNAPDASPRPDVWAVCELPVEAGDIPDAFLEDLDASGHLFVVEEHAAQGGLGQMLAHRLLAAGRAPARFTHRHALGYPSGRYGSQAFHRRECGLDAAGIAAELAAAATSAAGT